MSKSDYTVPVRPPLLAAEPQSVGAYEAKTHLPRLLDGVEQGQAYTITRHGRPVAQLIPIQSARTAHDIVARFQALASGRGLPGHDLDALIDEGHD